MLNNFKNLLILCAPFTALAIYSLIITLINHEQISVITIASGLDNFLQPVAIFLILNYCLYKDKLHDHRENVIFIFNALIFMLCLNSLFAIFSVYYDISSLNNLFKPSHSLIKNSTVLVRQTGIFDQPVESGLAYSIGLILWLYLFSLKSNKKFLSTSYEMTKLFLLFTGGIISISKTFLFCGIGLFVIINIFFYVPKRNLFRFLMVFASSLFFIFSEMAWPGESMFLGYFNKDNYKSYAAVSTLTGSRFNLNISSNGNIEIKSGVIDNFKITTKESAMGAGFTKSMSYDNGLLEFYNCAGFLGIFIFLYLVCLIFYIAWKLFYLDRSMSIYIGALCFLSLFANLGAPVFTLNRISVAYWMIFFTVYSNLRKLNCKSGTLLEPK